MTKTTLFLLRAFPANAGGNRWSWKVAYSFRGSKIWIIASRAWSAMRKCGEAEGVRYWWSSNRRRNRGPFRFDNKSSRVLRYCDTGTAVTLQSPNLTRVHLHGHRGRRFNLLTNCLHTLPDRTLSRDANHSVLLTP